MRSRSCSSRNRTASTRSPSSAPIAERPTAWGSRLVLGVGGVGEVGGKDGTGVRTGVRTIGEDARSKDAILQVAVPCFYFVWNGTVKLYPTTCPATPRGVWHFRHQRCGLI